MDAVHISRSLAFISFCISVPLVVFYWISHHSFRLNFSFFLRASGVILLLLSTMWCAGAVGDYSSAVRSDVLSRGIGFSVVLVVVGVLLKLSCNTRPKVREAEWLTDKPAPEPSAEKKKPDLVPITKIDLDPIFLDSFSGTPLRYRYDDVPIDVDAPFFSAAWFSPLVSSPWVRIRTGDSGALFYTSEDHIISKVSDSKLDKMARDWYNRDDPYYFPITSIDPEHNKIFISMLFYREGRHPIPMDEPGEESYRLIGNSRNAEMQEQIDLCEAGDDCALEYDADKDKYLVSCGAPIGYLPKAARRLVDEYGEDDVTVTIDSVGVDSDGRSWVCVIVDV